MNPNLAIPSHPPSRRLSAWLSACVNRRLARIPSDIYQLNAGTARDYVRWTWHLFIAGLILAPYLISQWLPHLLHLAFRPRLCARTTSA